MRVAVELAGGHDVAINSGTITGLDYSTVYHVYYDDPTFTGGAVTYSADTDQTVALDAEGRFYVGSILTPMAGGQDTIGNNDGGTGAQSGHTYTLWPTWRADDTTDPVSWYPVNSEDTDANDTTYVDVLGQQLIWLSSWPQISDKWVSLKLKVRSEVISVDTGGVAFVDYSLDGGVTWSVLYDVANGTTDVDSGGSGANSGTGTDWTNVGNIVSSDAQATVTALAHGDSTKYAYASDYGFALPTGATVLGIVVQFDETLSGSSFVVPPTFNVQLFDATGTAVGTVKTATAVEDGTIQLGNTEDLWESSWAYTDINNSNFGVGIQAVAPHVTTDWAADTYYSPDGLIIDSNGNLQQLYTPGTTGGSAPTWATTLSATTTDGSAVWVCIQLSASLTWAAHTQYADGHYVKHTVAGTDYLYKLTKVKVPHLKSGATNGWYWYGSGGAGTSTGAFNKLYPVADPGSAQHFANVRSGGSERPVLYWANPVSVNTKFKNLNGAGESTADTDTGRYENWQMAQVGYIYFPGGTWYGNISHDDGALIGFGTQLGGVGTITKVSGDLYAPARSVNNDYNLPTTRTARMGYQIFAGQNRAAPGTTLSTNFVITVSATGYYPVELDWSNWEHASSLRVRFKDSAGTFQDLVPNALNVAQTDTTLDVSGGSAPTFPAFSNSFAPSYASVYESAGQYQWLCVGAVADFTWYSSTDYARAGQVIIDSNGNGQVAYRPGKSNSSAAPFFTTTIGGLTDDTGNNLVWKNVGPTVGTATYDFAISNALISVTYTDPSSGSSRALTTDSVVLPLTQNLALVEVRYGCQIQDGEMKVYEVYVEGIAG